MKQASELFGVEFERLNDPSLVGTCKDIYISFDGGLESIAPLRPEDVMSRKYLDFFDAHGEGLDGLVFRVADIGADGPGPALGYRRSDMLQSPDPAVRPQVLRDLLEPVHRRTGGMHWAAGWHRGDLRGTPVPSLNGAVVGTGSMGSDGRSS